MILVEDRALLDGFRRGDRDALLRVYRHYAADVSRFLMRGFTFESDGRPCAFRGFAGGYEIEAALQEVFRRAFEERARLAYDGMRPYRAYLFRIARNAVLNDLKAKNPILFRYRSGRPVVLEPAPEPENAEATFDPSPEDLVEAREVARLIGAFKAELDERSLGVFRCRFEEGRSAERAASELGLTRSRVRTTEAKLRRNFLEYMKSRGYLETYRDEPREAASGITAGTLLVLLCGGFG